MSEVSIPYGVRSLNWMAHGACRRADPELFFPLSAVTAPEAGQVELAKAVCAPCAVRLACLAYAVETMPEGIWGGTTPAERNTARRRPSRRPFSPRYLSAVRPAVTGDQHALGQAAPHDRTAR